MTLTIQPKSKLLIIGDSITDCGRNRPIAEGAFNNLGDGYVHLAHALLRAVYPAHEIRVVNMGIGGNTVRDLKARWQSDVIDLQPDWLVIMIGINDVWRQFDAPTEPERHVLIDEYRATLNALVEQSKPLVQGLVLMTPFFIEPNQADPMRALMDKYSAVVKELAESHQSYFVDTQAAFNTLLKDLQPTSIASDRVHPNSTGHMAIARALLNTLGFRW